MVRVFFFLLGYILSIIGLVYIISYLNLIDIGYTFSNYVHFIISKHECNITFIGIILMIITFFKGEDKK
jgi:hypothetical protein